MIVVDKPFSACRYLDPFRIYLRSKYKLVQNGAQLSAGKLLSVLPPPKKKIVPKFSSLSRGTPRGQVCWSYSHWSQSYSVMCAEFCVKFWILAFPTNFVGIPQFLNLTYKSPPSSHHLAIGQWGLEILPINHLPPSVLREFQNLGPTISKCPHFQSYVKVSRRSAEASRR